MIPHLDLGELAVRHGFKVGDEARPLGATLEEDCLLMEDGAVVGAYISSVSSLDPIADKLLRVMNAQLLTPAVPKSLMKRSRGLTESYRSGHSRRATGCQVEQYSTILGGVPPKPHMRRTYATASSVHGAKGAKPFIKAALALAGRTEVLMRLLSPELYAAHVKATRCVAREWRFGGTGWTSMIANANIAAKYHLDGANIRNTFNAIYTKRYGAKGGNLSVPDYGVTVDQGDGSLLLYPAWRNLHGVTEIEQEFAGGYRNSFVFYPLRAFTDGTS
jgi:hypothetical protein